MNKNCRGARACCGTGRIRRRMDVQNSVSSGPSCAFDNPPMESLYRRPIEGAA
jgi:hypothetical protein